MSALLEQLAGRERRDECAKHDEVERLTVAIAGISEQLKCPGMDRIERLMLHADRSDMLARLKAITDPPEPKAPRTILRARDLNQTEQGE